MEYYSAMYYCYPQKQGWIFRHKDKQDIPDIQDCMLFDSIYMSKERQIGIE